MRVRKTGWLRANLLLAGATGMFAVTVLWSATLAQAPRTPASGSLAGSVSADRGEVRGLRVKAKDTVHRIAYTVFTSKGRYQIYNLPPSTYEVQVFEEDFDSPAQTIEVKAGPARTLTISGRCSAARWTGRSGGPHA